VKLALIARDPSHGAIALERIQSGARDHGLALKADLTVSAYAGHAVVTARERVADADLLVAVGGDGTLHEVINGAMAGLASASVASRPQVGLVAAGTANDFARSIAGEASVAQLLTALTADSWCNIDLGWMSLSGTAGEAREVYFINVADIGVGADVVRRVAGGGRRLGATVTYLIAIIRTLVGYRKRTVTIRSDQGLAFSGPLLAAAFGNGRCFGAGLTILPQASPDDGELDCIVVGNVGLREFIGKHHQLREGHLIDHPEVHYHRCRSLSVESAHRLGVEADGEFLGYLPATVRILPAAIRMPLLETPEA
jgi:YegS/Rv2252/BmrU family lipid kinase